MYLDRDAWPPPRPWEPPPRAPKPRDRGGTAAIWIVVAVALLSLLSPFAGATMIDALVALVRG